MTLDQLLANPRTVTRTVEMNVTLDWIPILRTCPADGRTRNGWRWPGTVGTVVVDPGWQPHGPHGFHGLPWGRGPQHKLNLHAHGDHRWMVVVAPREAIRPYLDHVVFAGGVIAYVAGWRAPCDEFIGRWAARAADAAARGAQGRVIDVQTVDPRAVLQPTPRALQAAPPPDFSRYAQPPRVQVPRGDEWTI